MRDEDKMKAFWWKLTVDWPCALGDWLWAYLAAPLLASLERLTFKRVIYLAAVTLAIMAFAQIVSIDLAFMWAGDVAFYFELTSAVMFFVVRGHIRQTVPVMVQKIRAAAQGVMVFIRRYGGIARQWRNANALRRKGRGERPKQSDDEPAAWIGGLSAPACG
jgi:hypothetical protein